MSEAHWKDFGRFDDMIEALLSGPLAQLGKSALAAPEPSDSDPLLAQFQAAIATFSTSKQGVDWPLVGRVGSELAAQRCDLKIYGYLALAVFHIGVSDGSAYLQLGAVLISLADFLGTPEGLARCVPRSDSRRQGQLKWLSEELGLLLQQSPPKPAHADAVRACLAAAERAGEVAGTALRLSYPLLRELREALKEQERALPAPVAPVTTAVVEAASVQTTTPLAAPAVPVIAATAARPAEPAAQSAAAALDVASLSMETVEDQLAELLIRLASHLRTESLESPASYWLVRALRWANHDLIRAERVAEVLANKGRSQLPPPQGHTRLRKDFSQRLASGQFAEVVAECEELFVLSPLWLDLQRFVAQGLTGLGAESARATVQGQLRTLLQICPQLPELRFSDREGTPFADSETVLWLQSECAEASTPNSSSTSRSDGPEESIPEGLLPGVQFLQQKIHQATSGARRFALRLRLSELLLRERRSDIAMPLVNLLLTDVESHRLTEWQPDLVQKTLRLAVQAARAAELAAEQRTILWSRICQLAPAEAVELGPELLPP